ncbi:MAG TPA: Fur family transcriptional regulator [Candidatus Saccharimonadales bacterium]|jgi:Fur family ferric uptake transcriptional regulator|nr:Fur family transcriptional regulator [Candidatus Saccharimonadales bacterium]
MEQTMDITLHNTLKASRRSLTPSRRMIFAILRAQGPVQIAAIVDTCANKLDRATVYRTLDLFERLGVINRVRHSDSTAVELSEIFVPHHHHGLCQQCGATIDLASTDLENAIAKLAKDSGFLAINHVVELQGYCKKCQR